MADVFVSYASDDRDRVAAIVAALEAAGYSVWWDRHIGAGRSFEKEIEAALDSAACVLVIWSTASVQSDWVRAEAADGLERGVLVPVAIDTVRPPLAFRRLQTLAADPVDAADLETIVAAVAPLVTGTVSSAHPQTIPTARPRPTPSLETGAATAMRTRPRLAIVAFDEGSSIAARVAAELETYVQASPFRVAVDTRDIAADVYPKTIAQQLDADYVIGLKSEADGEHRRFAIRLACPASGTHANATTSVDVDLPISECESLARAVYYWLDVAIYDDLAARLSRLPADDLDLWGVIAAPPSQGSIELLHRAVSSFPDSAIAHARLASNATIGFVAMGLPRTTTNRALIMEHANMAVQLAPIDPHVLRWTSYAFSLLGESALALPQAQEAGQRFPPYQTNCCFPLTRLGRGAEALELLDDTRRWGLPVAPNMWASFAEAFTVERDYENLAMAAERAMFRSRQVERPIRVHYANALGALGRTDEAHAQWQRVQDLDPSLTVDAWRRGWKMQLADEALVDAFTYGLEQAGLNEMDDS